MGYIVIFNNLVEISNVALLVVPTVYIADNHTPHPCGSDKIDNPDNLFMMCFT